MRAAYVRLAAALEHAARTHGRASAFYRACGRHTDADKELLLADEATRRADELRRRIDGMPGDAGLAVDAVRVRRPTPPRPPVADPRSLLAGMEMLGIDAVELWVQYVGVGGTVPSADLDRFLAGGSSVEAAQYDLLVLTLNERFSDRGFRHPVPYAGEE